MEQQGASGHEALLHSVKQQLLRQLQADLPAGLYLVATPIGNLADISLRALAVLAGADIIYCEDKRHSSRLLNHYGIVSRLASYHEHNGEHRRDLILAAMEEGKSVALVSDAGTPLVSDPGCKLVREAKRRHLSVVAIPGASAPLAALVSSGLPTDSFAFAGFLPARRAARRKRLREFADSSSTLIFFESPKRLKASLADLAEIFADRPAAIARELTKLHETVISAPVSEIAGYFSAREKIRGEIVIMVAGAGRSSQQADQDQLAAALRLELQDNSLRDAVQSVCCRFAQPRSKIYNLALSIKGEQEQ